MYISFSQQWKFADSSILDWEINGKVTKHPDKLDFKQEYILIEGSM